MKRYSDYKDSGVEWIGEVPSHWEVKKLKYIAKLQTGNSLNESQKGAYSQDINDFYNYISTKDIELDTGNIDYDNGLRIPLVEIKSFKKARKDSVLLCIEGGSAGRKVGYLSEDVCFVNKLANIDSDDINTKILFYTIKSKCFNQEFSSYISGLIGGVSLSNLSNFSFIIPTKEEQDKIVNYLDKTTVQIETLINKKKQLIETLKASRTKLISETVTKGINKNAPMKDSGVEWIGEIPKNYKIKNLRYLGSLQNGISKGAEEFGFGYPFVSYGDVYKNSVSNEVEGLVNSSKEDRRIYSVIEGDVFFTRTSETIEEIGFSSTCLETISDATFAGFLIRFRPNTNDLYKGYSKYYFRSDIHRKFFVKEMNLVTRASLGQNLLKNLPVVIPSYEEQIEISKYLDKKINIINNTISKIEEQIELLKKAKQKLITEVVTGKIDVTNL